MKSIPNGGVSLMKPMKKKKHPSSQKNEKEKMGKPGGKKKKNLKSGDLNANQSKSAAGGGGGGQGLKTLDKDEDEVVFITMSQELKEEGNKLFQKRDHEGAMLKYEKALKLLPKNHPDVAYLRSNMAACYMQMGIGEYPRAIHECNLALQASPKYSKAFLKRARCYEALNRLDLALRDVCSVLNNEPNNLTALEISERVRGVLEKKGIIVDDKGSISAPEYLEPPCASPKCKVVKEKKKKKSSSTNKASDQEKKVEDKVVVEVNGKPVKEEEELPKRNVKLVFGEDIRWAQMPGNCSIQQLREIIQKRFTNAKGAIVVKYKDQDGDLVTITSTEELRWAEALVDKQSSIKFYIVRVSTDQEPLLEGVMNKRKEVPMVVINQQNIKKHGSTGEFDKQEKESSYIDHWITQFACLFKNHVGFNSDDYLELHELGMKLFSEAVEDTVTNEDAQELFESAEGNFQEMAALALFNWGNVHMSKARKGVSFSEDTSKESLLIRAKTAYEWAQKEYVKAGNRYKEALRIKPDFYEAYLALGKQQFEQAKLSWCYTIGSRVDLETWPSSEVLQLFNNAEDNMETGLRMWEEMEVQRVTRLSKPDNLKLQLQKMGLDALLKDISAGEAAEQYTNMRAHINILWGTILYERSVVEFKLGIPLWEECLEVAVEKFELAGASATDIGVILKNHCAIRTAVDGLEFRIDEIVQAWNEMYDAKRWQLGVPSFRLEPLFRRRTPKLHHTLEHM